MFGWMFIRKQEYSLLLEEISLSRADLARERERADRLTDNIMMMAGQFPASTYVADDRKKAEEKSSKLSDELSELFNEETAAPAATPEDDSEERSLGDEIIVPSRG